MEFIAREFLGLNPLCWKLADVDSRWNWKIPTIGRIFRFVGTQVVSMDTLWTYQKKTYALTHAVCWRFESFVACPRFRLAIKKNHQAKVAAVARVTLAEMGASMVPPILRDNWGSR